MMWILIAIISAAIAQNVSHFLDNQKKLYGDLFVDYNAKLGMVNTLVTNVSYEEPYRVNVSMMYLKLIDVNEPEESITLIAEYEMSWTDSRLAWDPADYGGIDSMFVPRTDVWVPQLSPVNAPSLSDFRPEYQQYARLTSSGEVVFYVQLVVASICNYDVSEFPFDVQNCNLMMMTNTYTLAEFRMLLRIDQLVMNIEQSGNGEWKMQNITTSQYTLNENELYGAQISQFTFNIGRYSTFYISMIVIPSFVINGLSILGIFLSKNDKMGKLTIGLTNLMSMTFIMGILTDAVPKTRHMPLLAIYVIVNLAIMVVAVVFTIVVPYFYRKIKHIAKKTTDEEKEVPRRRFWMNKAHLNGFLMIFLQAANVFNFIYLFL